MDEINSAVKRAIAAAEPYPEYKQILEYLTAAKFTPPVVAADLPDGVLGSYVMPGFTDQKYKAPVIEMDRFSTVTRSLPDVASTLIHESTHAAQTAMRRQSKDGGEQFKQAYQKLYAAPKGVRERDGPLPALAKQLDASWEDSKSDYRATPHEIQAFGVGNSATKRLTSARSAPAHLDATAATEFMILLDLALRDLKSRK